MKKDSCLSRKLFLLVCSLLLAISSPQFALAKTKLANIEIINQATGQTLKTYKHKGQLWIAGNPGERYAIKVMNPTDERILSVISVDGINIISGETAAVNQGGYVLQANDSMEINGWRKSNNDVARFYFTSIDDSYASKTKRPANVGIIGVALFREYKKPEVVTQMMYRSSEKAKMDEVLPKNNSLDNKYSLSEKLGTGHGERMNSPSISVKFQKQSTTPEQIITIRYDSLNNLQAMGIAPRESHMRIPPKPQAFPAQQFVPDPE